MKKTTTIIIASIFASSGAGASVIALDPSILPSNQAWDYSAVGLHSGSVETNVSSVGGGNGWEVKHFSLNCASSAESVG